MFNKKLIKLILPVVIVINSYPTSISLDPFDVNITINGAKAATNYLKVQIYKDSADYFGETWNGKTWYSGSDNLSYLPVEINSSSVSATIKARVGDENKYRGPGSYKLKIKRYTASGNAANDTQTPVDVTLTYTKETPQPSPILTSSPTLTSSPKVISTVSPKILAATSSINPTSSPTPTSSILPEKPKKDTFTLFPALMFATGLFSVGIASFLIYTKFNAQKNH